MVGPNFMDEIDCGSFFDNIDNLLDFPVDDVDATAAASLSTVTSAANCNSLASIWPNESDSFPGSDSVFSGNSPSDLSVELSVPYEDILPLEWLSTFVEDSFSEGSLTMKKVEQPPSSCVTTKEDSVHNQFQTSSPVSVLESSSSCSGGKPTMTAGIYIPVPCGRARTKRPRPATFNPRSAMQLISPTSSFVAENVQPNVISTKAAASSNFDNFAESQIVAKKPKLPPGESKKKKKIKMPLPAAPADSGEQNGSLPVRKCMHCEITKTPQWRAGPLGPKTLCNACGVRYKSGRLFPEYRPAASPTFCPSLHSNSHKKVLEMRTKDIDSSGFESHSAASPELIPNTNSILALEYI
ncbi:unnamed protein product [Vicia faba]|uniref:GATA transcription factor n=1 Tax=Vicia faba TaxID=3906 RepID=A0AAV1A4F0_VICFA|nr:unnamed protein product [Vicia faba]